MVKKQKKQGWKLLSVVLSPLLLLVIGLFCCKSSFSFHLNEIRPTRDFPFQTVQTVSKEEQQKLHMIFSQPFYYLSEGDRCYVFESQDHEYVLKFFKMKNLTPKYWLNYIPLPWLEKLRIYKVGGRERARQETFGGFKIAFEEFRHQTGLLFVHLFQTNWLKTRVRVKDAEQRTHLIALDSVPFVLQKKAVLLCDYVDHLIQNKKEKEAVGSLLLVLDLIKERSQRGLSGDETKIELDYGFIGDKPVYMDVGHMLHDESLKNPLNTLRSVFRASQDMEEWVKNHYPSLLFEFHKEVQDLLSLLEEEA
jgi:hypothetical protein